jgi:hypothetical protein
VSGSSDVIEVPLSKGPNPGPIQTFEPAEPAASDGELILAGIIGDAHGPIIRQEDEYEGEGDENAAAVANAHVYKILTNRSYLRLELHLEKCPKVRESLGLKGVLDHTTFSRSWREQFHPSTKAYLENEYCEYIRDELERISYGDDPEPALAPYFEPPEPPESLPEIPQGEIDTAIKHVKEILLGTTDFDRGPETTYADSELFDIALDACREGSEFNPIIDDNGHEPALKTFMNALKNRDGHDWQEEFKRVNARVLNAGKGAGMLDRPVDCDLDITILPVYPQNLDPPKGARKGEKKRGTIHGFHFGTMVAHDDDHDKDLVVAQVPYTDDMKPLDLVIELVEQAREHCSIKTLTLDSAFSGTGVIHYLKQENIKFGTRLKRHGKDIKGVLAQMTETYDDFDDFTIKASGSNLKESVRVVSEPDWKHAKRDKRYLKRPVETSQTTLENFEHEGDPRIPKIDDLDSMLWKCRRPYATNMERAPKRFIRRYKLRWRVENSYADKKSKLLGKTQSRHHGVRVFLFWLTTILYNGWMLARTFIRLDFPNHAPRDRPPVSARQFMKSILGIPYG